MKRVILVLTLLILSGCYCRTCRAQALDDRGPFSNPGHVIDATCCVEWYKVHADIGVPRHASELLFESLVHAPFIWDTSTSLRYELTDVEWNPWFNLQPSGKELADSYLLRVYHLDAKMEAQTHKPGLSSFGLRNLYADAGAALEAVDAARLQARIEAYLEPSKPLSLETKSEKSVEAIK